MGRGRVCRSRRDWLALLATLSLMTSACQTNRDFEIQSGLFSLCIEEYGVVKTIRVSSSHTIPRALGRWEYFGFFISRRSEVPFEVVTVTRLPSAPPRLGPELSKKYKPADAVQGLRSDPLTILGGRLVGSSLDPDDPLGRYTMTIFVDDAEFSTLTFHVADIPRTPYEGEAPQRCQSLRDGQL